jgi:hypothetical protein
MSLKPQGNVESPIWLVGDSDPEGLKPSDLEFVFDDRHPTIHNIWTPIIYKMQKKAYKDKRELEDKQFYIRNAIENANMKPGKYAHSWDDSNFFLKKIKYIKEQMKNTEELIIEGKPKMVITFGGFSFEFIRRCCGIKKEEECQYRNWTVIELRKEFIKSINDEEIKNDKGIKIFPLLHKIISENYLYCHKNFSHDNLENNINGNYFEYVADKLYKKIIKIIKLKKINCT